MFNLSTFTKNLEENSQHFSLFDVLSQMENMLVTAVSTSLTQLSAITLTDEGDHYVVKAQVGSCTKDDINLLVEDHRLLLKIKQRSQFQGENHQGSSYQTMMQSINLDDVDVDFITASLDRGELKVILPKKDIVLVQRKVIEIK